MRWILAIAMLAAGCAGSAANLRSRDPGGAAEVRLCKTVDIRRNASGILVTTEPVEVTDIFYASDWRVIAWVSLGPLRRQHRVRWVWYDPSGEKYLDSGDVKANPRGAPKRFNHLWQALRIWGEGAAKRPGRWNVTVYLDGQPLASRDFTLRSR